MWPFKKKEVEATKIDIRIKNMNDTIEKFKAFREIGETFNYLGRTCIVTGHWTFSGYMGYTPELKFDYADELGVIHSTSITIHELPVLLKQNSA